MRATGPCRPRYATSHMPLWIQGPPHTSRTWTDVTASRRAKPRMPPSAPACPANRRAISWAHTCSTCLDAHHSMTSWHFVVQPSCALYYYNKVLSISQYNRPAAADSPPLPPPPSQSRPSAARSPLRASTKTPQLPVSHGSQVQAWQRACETARLRAMIPLLKGTELADAYGALAALEASW